MAFPENGYVPPRVADVRSSANKTATLAILVIVVLLIGLPAVFVTTAVLSAKKTSGAAIGVGNEFLGDIESENYSAAHDLFLPELQSSIPTKSISGIFGGLTAAHGNLETWDKPQWFVQTYNGVTYVRLTYSVVFDQGMNTVTLIMQKTSAGVYRIRNFNISA